MSAACVDAPLLQIRHQRVIPAPGTITNVSRADDKRYLRANLELRMTSKKSKKKVITQAVLKSDSVTQRILELENASNGERLKAIHQIGRILVDAGITDAQLPYIATVTRISERELKARMELVLMFGNFFDLVNSFEKNRPFPSWESLKARLFEQESGSYRISFGITSTQRQRGIVLAEKLGVSLAEFGRLAIEDYIARAKAHVK